MKQAVPVNENQSQVQPFARRSFGYSPVGQEVARPVDASIDTFAPVRESARSVTRVALLETLPRRPCYTDTGSALLTCPKPLAAMQKS